MVFSIIVVTVLAVLLIATYTDIRWREVPDWLSYSAIAAGLGIRGIMSILALDASLIISGVIGLGLMFLLGMAMFYLGQWGGGDSKALMGLGSLLGIELSFQSDLLAFLISLAVVGGVYGLLWTLGMAVRYRDRLGSSLRLHFSKRAVRIPGILMLILCAFGIGFSIFFSNPILAVLALALPLFYFLLVSMKTIETCCFVQELATNALTEGDWIARDIIVKGERICGPRDLGISKKQIKTLKRYHIKNVQVKVGMPFLPAFLIAYIVVLVVGNPLLLVL